MIRIQNLKSKVRVVCNGPFNIEKSIKDFEEIPVNARTMLCDYFVFDFKVIYKGYTAKFRDIADRYKLHYDLKPNTDGTISVVFFE